MSRFILRRLARAALTLLVFQTVLFLLIQSLPGDYAALARRAPMQSQGLRAVLGLDAPLWEQYLGWMGAFLSGDLGRSYEPPYLAVSQLLWLRTPRTLLLFLPAVLLGFGLGVAAGKRIAWRTPRRTEVAISLGGVACSAAFPPWLAFLLVNLFAFELGWLPAEDLIDEVHWVTAPATPEAVIVGLLLSMGAVAGAAWLARRLSRAQAPRAIASGRGRTAWLLAAAVWPLRGKILVPSAALGAAWWASGWAPLALDILRHLALPLATLTLLSFGETMLVMRSAMLDAYDDDAVRLARAKGLTERQVRDRHVARLALLPVLGRAVERRPAAGLGHHPVLRRAVHVGAGGGGDEGSGDG